MLGIIAGILVARHLKSAEDLQDESLIASAVQWADRIMRRIAMECSLTPSMRSEAGVCEHDTWRCECINEGSEQGISRINVRFSRGAVMSGSGGVSPQRPRVLNSVPLQNAVLCAECDVVSDSPHDICLVCGSRSLFNIARIFGGKLPPERANLITQEVVAARSRDVVLTFPKPQRLRRRATAGARQLTVVGFDDNESDEVERGVLCGPQGR